MANIAPGAGQTAISRRSRATYAIKKSMKARITAFLLAAAATGTTQAQEALFLRNVSNRVIDGGSYKSIEIRNSSNVVIRNASFLLNSVGHVVDIQASTSVTVEDSDLQGSGVACTGINIGDSTNIHIKGNRIHNIADDGVQVSNSSELTIEGNTIYGLLGIGTDSGGPCFNGHSDAIEMFTVRNAKLRGNLVFDVRSTSALFFGNTATSFAGYNRNILIENNIFMTPESGFVAYISHAEGVKLYNNTFWWGRYGGLVIGTEVTNFEAINNVLHSINYSHLKPAYSATQHVFKNNLIGTTSGQQTPSTIELSGNNFVASDPLFNSVPGLARVGAPSSYRQTSLTGSPRFSATDFMPKALSPMLNAGVRAAGIPTVDFRNVARPQSSVVNLGALQGP